MSRFQTTYIFSVLTFCLLTLNTKAQQASDKKGDLTKDIPPQEYPELAPKKIVPIPDEENGAALLNNVVKNIQKSEVFGEDYDRAEMKLSNNLKTHKVNIQKWTTFFNNQKDLLKKIEIIINKHQIQPKIPINADDSQVEIFSLIHIVKLFSFKGKIDLVNGDVASAYHQAKILEKLHSKILTADKVLTGEIVTQYIYTEHLNLIEKILSHKNTTNDQILSIIKTLEAPKPFNESIRQSLNQETTFILKGWDDLFKKAEKDKALLEYIWEANLGKKPPIETEELIKKYHPNRTKKLTIQLFDYFQTLARTPRHKHHEIPSPKSYTAIIAKNEKDLLDSPNTAGEFFFKYTSQALFNFPTKHFDRENHRRALILLAVIRLYHNKHGKLPDSLDNLPKEHKKILLPDVYSNRTFLYSKEKKIIYSLGKDLIGGMGDNPTGFGHSILKDEDPTISLSFE